MTTSTQAATCTPLAAPSLPEEPQCHRRGWLSAIAAFSIVGILLAGTVGVIVNIGPADEPLAIAAASTPNPGASKQLATPSPLPRDVPSSTLAALADRLLANAPAEGQGRYTYVSVEQWFSQADGISAQREQRWFDTQTRRFFSATRTLPTVSPEQFRADAVGHGDFTSAEFTDSQYLVPLRSMPQPLSDNPEELRRTIQESTPGSTPGMLGFVAAMSFDTHPPVGVRAAALHLLATVEGLTVTEHITDTLGRPGIAITAASSETTATLIIDPATGLTLAYNADHHASTGNITSSQWSLILDNSRTDVLNLPSA